MYETGAARWACLRVVVSSPANMEAEGSNPAPSQQARANFDRAPAADGARPNVADPGKHLVGHWIDERIDLAHIYAEIWKMRSRLTSSMPRCSATAATRYGDRGGARRETAISLSGIDSHRPNHSGSGVSTYENPCRVAAGDP